MPILMQNHAGGSIVFLHPPPFPAPHLLEILVPASSRTCPDRDTSALNKSFINHYTGKNNNNKKHNKNKKQTNNNNRRIKDKAQSLTNTLALDFYPLSSYIKIFLHADIFLHSFPFRDHSSWNLFDL